MPVKTKIIDPKTEEEKAIVVSDDDGIRPGVTVQSLGQLRTVFKKDGTTTAGNSSQVRSFLFFLFFREGEREEVEEEVEVEKLSTFLFRLPVFSMRLFASATVLNRQMHRALSIGGRGRV